MIKDFFNTIKGNDKSNTILIDGYKIDMLKGMIEKDENIYIKTHNTFESSVFKAYFIRLECNNIYFISKNRLNYIRIQAHVNAEVTIKNNSIIFKYFL